MADLSSPKIMSRERLLEFTEECRSRGLRLVTTNGTFDLLHVGHVKSLEEARSMGDVLIVGLNSDSSVRSYKTPERPFLPDVERAYILASLTCVDAVHIMEERDISVPLIEMVRPDVHVKGKQYEGACGEQVLIEDMGGAMHFAEMVEGISTTDVARTVIEKTSALQRE
jgi:D-beta-D-heptose 7-phosphate kinase/D-beta-D-heptose 1-phosphate adenosyltransferase